MTCIYYVCDFHKEMLLVGDVKGLHGRDTPEVETLGARPATVIQALGLFGVDHRGCSLRAALSSELDAVDDDYITIFDGESPGFISYETYILRRR